MTGTLVRLCRYHRYILVFTKGALVKCLSSTHWFHHRSGSTHTIFFCSSQMTVRRRVSREAWSHQESGSTLWYRHGSLSSSGSSFWEQASSCSSDWPWRCSLDLKMSQQRQHFASTFTNQSEQSQGPPECDVFIRREEETTARPRVTEELLLKPERHRCSDSLGI